MFSGIVEAIGRVERLSGPQPDPAGTPAYRLEIAAGDLFADLALGASVAVNGACLTLAQRHAQSGRFDVIPETWRNTSLQTLRVGDPVNLERSLRVGDRIDGHFVQGHVDGVGTVQRVEATGQWKLWVAAPAHLLPYLVRKGSVTLDGTSLTIVDVAADGFSVALIPTTLERTVLARRRPGDPVNIETDVIARIVVGYLHAGDANPAAAPSGLTLERLRADGFT